MVNMLCHYCSLETFLKIITNRTLRASDCSKTNDTEETKWISGVLKEVSSSDILNSQTIIAKYGLNYNDIKRILEILPKLIYLLFNNGDKITRTYTICFSESSDLLSQWRGYADDAKGVPIGFGKGLLASFTKFRCYHFGKVKYSDISQRNYIKRNVVNSFINNTDNNLNYDLFMNILTVSLIIAREFSAQFKNPVFSEEKEWRLFVNMHPIGSLKIFDGETDLYMRDEILSNGFVRNKICFTQTNTRIVPYIDFNFDKVKGDFVKQIVLGPKRDANVSDIELLLSSQSFIPVDISITKLRATYR